MKKTERRRRPEGSGWDDNPRHSGLKDRFVEKKQQWQDYLVTGPDVEGDLGDDGVEAGHAEVDDVAGDPDEEQS